MGEVRKKEECTVMTTQARNKDAGQLARLKTSVPHTLMERENSGEDESMTMRRAFGMLSIAAGAICLIQTSGKMPISFNIILIVLTVALVILGMHLLER